MARLVTSQVDALRLVARQPGAVEMLRPQNSGVSVGKCDTRFFASVF
jgi:hypothetical protein